MKLKFRIETRKIKQPRIVVLRLFNEEGKIVEKSLGSFSSKRSYEHILKQLTSEELYEFESFVKTINFSKTNFNCDADKLDRFIIKTAPEFKDALFKIWEKAKEYNIEFIPEYEMLSTVFKKAKIVEQQLAVLTNDEFKALDSLGINITDLEPPKRDLKENHKLFTAVVENTKSLEELAELFNAITSKKYQKAPKFKPHHFEYLKNPAEQGNFPKWYYTVAIDVLCNVGVKPDTIVSPALVTEHWLRLNKKENLELTLKEFNHQFQHLKNNPICTNIIKEFFINDELSKMSGNPHPIPSSAIEHWLKHWKNRNPRANKKAAIQAFNKEFTLLADNPFFIKFIEKNLQEETYGNSSN